MSPLVLILQLFKKKIFVDKCCIFFAAFRVTQPTCQSNNEEIAASSFCCCVTEYHHSHTLSDSGQQMWFLGLCRYDLVDVTREALQLVFMLFYGETVRHYQQQNHTLFKLVNNCIVT